ncbi:MAG: mycothiol conjugate amidase Mca [Acidimicrobiia bacterium]
MARTILALHAHPDDESSKGAATVARYVSEGASAVLVTATGGEAGDILNPAMDKPGILENLKAVREDELAAAAKTIGYDEVILLGYRDSGMPDSEDNSRPEAFCNQDEDEVLSQLVSIVRKHRPDVVLGYDSHEFYPHPDHLYVHRLSMEVFVAAADAERFPDQGPPFEIQKMYAPVFTAERITALHEAMLSRTGSSPYARWMDALQDRTLPDRKLTRIRVDGWIDQGRDALRAHQTQVDPDGFWFEVPTAVIEEVYPWEDFELLASRVPWDPDEDDLFAGID